MPLKVSVRMECAVCHKKIAIKGKPEKHRGRYRRYSSIFMPDVYVVTPPFADDEPIVAQCSIARGYDYTDNDDEEGLCCSVECAIKLAEKYVRKMKRHPSYDDKEED